MHEIRSDRIKTVILFGVLAVALSLAACRRFGPGVQVPGTPAADAESAPGQREPPPLNPTEEQAVRQSAQAEIERQSRPGDGLEIIGIRGEADWAVIDCRPPATSVSTEGAILLGYRDDAGAWQIAYPGTAEFNSRLERLPDAYYPAELKDFFYSAAAPAEDSSGVYKLPYASGLNALVTCTDCYAGHDPAIDFLVLNGQAVVAAAAGTIEAIVADNTECCCSYNCYRCNNQVIIRHPNGEQSRYFHLSTGSVPGELQVGTWVRQGQPIGSQGDTGYSCGTRGRYEVGCAAGKVSPVDGRRCGTHIHFEVRSAAGDKIRPRFQDVWERYGTWYVSQDERYVSGNDDALPLDSSPPDTTLVSAPTGWISATVAQLSWIGLDEQTPLADLVYSFRLEGYADWSDWSSMTNTTWYNLPGGTHTFRVKARDIAGNEDTSPATRDFGVDLSPPQPPPIVLGGYDCENVWNNVWQNTCSDPAFNWTSLEASDYHFYWGPVSDGAPTVWTSATSYDPTAIARTRGYGSYYLNVTARDSLGHESSPATFGLRYDGSVPTVSLRIEGGLTTTGQTAVVLDLPAADAGSGLDSVRLSNEELLWSDWLPYTGTLAWELLPLDGHSLLVYGQVRDRAGNLSEVSTDTIRLEMQSPISTPVPTPAPSAGSILTPQVNSFGIVINADMTYTQDAQVVVRAWAPEVTHMGLGNGAPSLDGTPFLDDALIWSAFQVTSTWTLSTSGGLSGLCRVYSRFRDASGAEYGPYFDDIVYDGLAPAGKIMPAGGGVTLWLDAWDDYSGVDQMRLSGSLPITLASWQPYTSSVAWPLPAISVSVQFRDRAGNVSPVYSSAAIWRVYLPVAIK
ncbi:MAG: peptidoglycan DD-metalloendopeptidase family protein [Thermoflexales bacterium]|nr:peptidoglycan DD-metalloendopeptidase family protein [Thermoflexales bacterium]